MAGIIAGVFIVAYTTLAGTTIGGLFPFLPQAVNDLNVGIAALLFNLLFMLGVSIVTRSSDVNKAADEERTA